MKIAIAALIAVLSLGASAQIPAPQINLTGNIGCNGFPCVNNGILNLTTDADHSMTAQETSAFYMRVTSSVTLTATRKLIYPAGRFPVGIENATTGGQALNVCGASGACVSIPNSTTTYTPVWNDGTNFVSGAGVSSGGGTVTAFSAGNLSPLFTTSVATSTTTPALTFALSNAAANTIFGNLTGSSAPPSFVATQGTDSKVLTSGTVSGTAGVTLCTDSVGGATTTGCSGGGSGITGGTAGYVPVFGSATTITGDAHLDDGVTTAGTLTATEPIAITGSTHGLTIAAGTAVSGATGKVVYASDATNGYAEVNENNTGLARICTSTNGVCSGGFTNPMSAVGDLIYGGTSGTATRLAGNITTTQLYLCQTGTGSVSAAPSWCSITSGATLQTNGTTNASQTTLNHQNSSGAGEIDFTNPSAGNVQAVVHNTSTTVNGQTCTLGSTCTITAATTNYVDNQAAVCSGGVSFPAGLTTYDNNQPAPGCTLPASSTVGYLAFNQTPTNPQYAEARVALPAYWTASSITIYWYTTATSGSVIWEIQTACPASGSTVGSPTFSSALTVTSTAPATAGTLAVATIANIATAGVNGCPSASTTPGQLIYRIFRSASDTAAANALLTDVTLSTSRTQ